MVGLGAFSGWDVRRADRVFWYLTEAGLLAEADVRTPESIDDVAILRVHSAAVLERLTDRRALAGVFGVPEGAIPLPGLPLALRTATFGTLAAAREVLKTQGHAINLLGGFHHAGPDKVAASCMINDVAVAIAAVRADGFSGRIAVLDLDAHAGQGTARCLANQPDCWLGTLSQAGEPDVAAHRHFLLPPDADDAVYLEHMQRLLGDLPEAELTFVIAGGDVLAGDRRGQLQLTLDGARRRDLLCADALAGRAAVWLPGGGYHRDAWRLLAGTVLAAFGRGSPESTQTVPRDDPLDAHFEHVASALEPTALSGEAVFLNEADLAEAMGYGSKHARTRLLGFYTADGVAYAMDKLGIITHLKGLGFDDLRVSLSAVAEGDAFRVFGWAGGGEHLLMESVMDRRRLRGRDVLFVNWLLLQNPTTQFPNNRPALPGQDAPGLGLARESWLTFGLMARRLGLDGVAMRPSWYHVAFASRRALRFIDPARQGRFEALMRDLALVPLAELTHAVAEGRVTLNGEPYTWEPSDMAWWMDDRAEDDTETAQEREQSIFKLRD